MRGRRETYNMSLRAEDIKDCRNLEGKIGKDTLARFKSLTERGCTPLQVRSRKAENVDVELYPFAAPHGKTPPMLKLPEKLAVKADTIVKEESKKTWPDEWKDGEKLSVRSAGVVSDNLILLVSRMKWSHVLAIKDLPLDKVADIGAFKLDTNTHIIAQDSNHRVLVIAKEAWAATWRPKTRSSGPWQ